MGKQCELYDRECIECGECDMCDLDPSKKCTNCGKCIDDVEEYRTVNLDDFIERHEEKVKYKKSIQKVKVRHKKES